MKMNDGQKKTINHIYHFLRDLLYKYDTGDFLCNGMKPSQTDLKSMIRYLETNFPKDMLEHESIVMVSGCCAVEILDGDICSDCKEHCEPIPEGDEDAIWHEEQLRAFENEGGTYSEKMQDNLEPIEDDKDEDIS